MEQNCLYSNMAIYYDVIAQDRDFLHECNEILSCYSSNNQSKNASSILELFAGPAYHSEALTKLGISVLCAIDNSEQMKQLAFARHSIDNVNYILCEIPFNLLEKLSNKKFDIILILRYSLGLLNRKQVKILFNLLPKILNSGGIIVLELHTLNLLFSNFNSLNIRKRTKKLNNTESITCIWPSGPSVWSEDDWESLMPIEIQHFDGHHLHTYKTFSKEIIYTKQYIASILPKQLNVIEHSIRNNNQSKLIVIRRN